jgi:ABC-2 type transport system permease protein
MNAKLIAVRAGLVRGRIELRQTFTNAQDLWNYLFPTEILHVVMVFMRDSTVPGTNFSLGSRTLPSVLGMGVVFGGLVTVAMLLTVEREDGTLLRAKAVPQGMVGYLVGRIVSLSLITLFMLVIILVAGLLLLPDLATAGGSDWLVLLWVATLGLLATLPWGAVIGSLVRSPNSAFGLTMLPLIALTAISGIFYPISALPGWVQGVAQVFPIYWLGLGIRSALLPDAAAVLEISGSWRHLETAAVLGAWAVAGLLVAPPVLRRMARRESGSTMEARRQQHLQRTP